MFEQKQYLQSYEAESSMQTKILFFLTTKRLVGTTTSYFPGPLHHKPR